jgi:hypothetical protein
MNNRFLFLLAIAAMLFACSEDSVFTDLTKSADGTTLNSEIKKGHKGKAVTKTIKIRGTGEVVYLPDHINEFGMQVYKAVVEGQGNASHLGKFTINLNYYAVYIPIPDTDGNPIEPIVYTYWPISPISGVQTAANGDQLFTVAYGPNPDGSLHFMYDKGTGRFEFVTGFVDLFFSWADDFNYSNYGQGEITY